MPPSTVATSQFVQRRPAGPVRSHVAGYVGYREYGSAPGRHRGLPSPYLTLIITLDEPLTVAEHPDPAAPPGDYDALVGGLHTRPALITHPGRQSGVALSLSPLGARALLGVPAGELVDADLPADVVLGRFGQELTERVRSAATWVGRFDVLDDLLARRIAGSDATVPAEVTRAWRTLLASGGRRTTGSIAAEVGWSGRYLSRRFGTEIGFSPKTVARLVRFDRVRWRLAATAYATTPALVPGGGLARLAAEGGYADQAHLAREFREFAGCAPSVWLREEFRNVQAAGPGPLPDSAA